MHRDSRVSIYLCFWFFNHTFFNIVQKYLRTRDWMKNMSVLDKSTKYCWLIALLSTSVLCAQKKYSQDPNTGLVHLSNGGKCPVMKCSVFKPCFTLLTKIFHAFTHYWCDAFIHLKDCQVYKSKELRRPWWYPTKDVVWRIKLWLAELTSKFLQIALQGAVLDKSIIFEHKNDNANNWQAQIKFSIM